MIGILIEHKRDRLLILHLPRWYPLRRQQPAEFAPYPPHLVRDRLVHFQIPVLRDLDLVTALGAAECEHGEAIVVPALSLLSIVGEEAYEGVSDDVEIGEVSIEALFVPPPEVVELFVAVDGPGEDAEDFQTWEVGEVFLSIYVSSDGWVMFLR